MSNNRYNLVVRFSDNMFDVGNVVERRNKVVCQYGYVWFGKMGGTISLQRIELLNKQIGANEPTFLYLAQGNWKKPRFYRAELLAVARELPEREKRRIPGYYSKKKLLDLMGVWMKIGRIVLVEATTLRNLKTVGSALPLQETLVRSSSGYFMVHELERSPI